MNIRLASVATALALTLAVPASALAQGYAASGNVPVTAVETGPGWQPRSAGAVAQLRGGVDSSAKGGNAAQPERTVPQYGNTAGGPAY
ncbi:MULTISPECIES: hypothetical protein [Methylobacterium]|uniref:Uncharacterized protein n=1 Tax=Methylobacterium thuringiense TaxID=1003091 RepID=A0ABQ4TPB5_9HYPH|nr:MULTISPECIES: hypothetical protein [Methylobacterium]TXN19885.1 hypothetical protein FV217_19910 [Methylobacterium sp. WL9]GJE55890.1 hypothetical protein EKPJFOCH_2387 [Methylobacterium thuringiense]